MSQNSSKTWAKKVVKDLEGPEGPSGEGPLPEGGEGEQEGDREPPKQTVPKKTKRNKRDKDVVPKPQAQQEPGRGGRTGRQRRPPDRYGIPVSH